MNENYAYKLSWFKNQLLIMLMKGQKSDKIKYD